MSAGRAARWAVALAACGVLAMAACGDDDTTDEDPIAAAQQRVSDAEDALDEARSAFDEARVAFCEDSTSYVDAVDRYGSVMSDDAVTVGDVTTAGADLEEPREAVRSSADSVVEARDEVAGAEQDLAEAEADLAEAQSGTTDPATGTTTTTEPLVPAATVDLVEDAEDDLASAFEGVTPSTPLTDATEQVNAAAFAVEVAWLRLFADAGCLSDEQQEEAVTAVVEYTTAVQTSLQTAGYYDGDVDGVYGPETVDAVEALQTDNDLPVTGLVDRATADALDAAVEASGSQAAGEALTHTAAVQSTLKLAGYWTGAVDGEWTPELTDALMEFQTALGVEPTGAVDAATLSALEQRIADAQREAESSATTTTSDGTTTMADD